MNSKPDFKRVDYSEENLYPATAEEVRTPEGHHNLNNRLTSQHDEKDYFHPDVDRDQQTLNEGPKQISKDREMKELNEDEQIEIPQKEPQSAASSLRTMTLIYLLYLHGFGKRGSHLASMIEALAEHEDLEVEYLEAVNKAHDAYRFNLDNLKTDEQIYYLVEKIEKILPEFTKLLKENVSKAYCDIALLEDLTVNIQFEKVGDSFVSDVVNLPKAMVSLLEKCAMYFLLKADCDTVKTCVELSAKVILPDSYQADLQAPLDAKEQGYVFDLQDIEIFPSPLAYNRLDTAFTLIFESEQSNLTDEASIFLIVASEWCLKYSKYMNS